ncbi:hypothetical protein Bca101_082603 [Brassica carinata]
MKTPPLLSVFVRFLVLDDGDGRGKLGSQIEFFTDTDPFIPQNQKLISPFNCKHGLTLIHG